MTLMVVHAAASALELIDVVLAAIQAMPAMIFVHAAPVVISRFLQSGHLKSRICAFLRGPIGATSSVCHGHSPLACMSLF